MAGAAAKRFLSYLQKLKNNNNDQLRQKEVQAWRLEAEGFKPATEDVAEGEAGEMGAPGAEATPARPNIASMSSRMVRRRFSFSLVVSSSFCFFATVSNSGRGAMLGSSSSTRSRGQGIPLISLRAVPR